MRLCVFSSLAAAGLFLSFSIPFGFAAPSSRDGPLKVAIIGAGAGGSSAAFFLGKAKDRFGRDIKIEIFERGSYIGGRSTIIHPYDDPSITPRELGASIFVEGNKNLVRAASEFGFSLVSDEEGSGTGVWDGKNFVVKLTGGPDDTDMVAKYGLDSLVTADTAAGQFAAQVGRLYSPNVFSWNTVEKLSEALQATDVVGKTAAAWMDGLGVNPLYTREFIEATTRVNYGQDIDKIHGLGAAASLVAGGPLYSVGGGNRKVFQEFVTRAGSIVHLDTRVVALAKVTVGKKTKWLLTAISKSSGKKEIDFGLYDYVIFAAPKGSSGVKFINSKAKFPSVPYVKLHTTFVSTTSRFPQSSFFGLGTNSTLGFGGVLTSAQGARNGGPLPDFNSIGSWGHIERNNQTEYIYKVFTLEAKSDKWLESLFGKGTIGWTYRKEWDAYPYLTPTTTFPSVRPDDGLLYVNSLEPWLSTMETQTISGRNAADLLLKEVYGTGICYGDTVPTWTEDELKKKVYGWDC